MARQLDLEWEPLDAPGVSDEAEAATWARLRVQLPGLPGASGLLTRVLDRHARTVRDHVYGTILPLAEWLVVSWPHIFRSHRAQPAHDALRSERYEWARVRRWRYAGQGAAVPNLEFAFRDDSTVSLRWWRDNEAESRFERVLFISDGEFALEPKALEESLRDFVVSILERLQERAPQHVRTQALREGWQQATDPAAPDYHARTLAALVGALWTSLPSSQHETLRHLAQNDFGQMETQLLQAASLADAEEYLKEARAIRECGAKTPQAASSWGDLWQRVAASPSEQPPRSAPWLRGWDAAKRLRHALGRDPASTISPSEVWEEIPCHSRSLKIPRVDAIVAWSTGHQPVRASSSPVGKDKFWLARDLHPVLFGPPPSSAHGVVHSRYVVGSSSVANAFATELLAPVESVRSLVRGRRTLDHDDLADMAKGLDAPYSCVLHQIENHRLALVS